MEAFIYLFKVNIAIILLYGFYRLFFQSDTFFQWKRILLLSVFFIALLYPFGDVFQGWIKNNQLNESLKTGVFFPSHYLNGIIVANDGNGAKDPISGQNFFPQLLWGIYGLVVLVLFCRIIIQMISIFIIIKRSELKEIEGQKVYFSKGIRTPFSFFRWVVLDSDQQKDDEAREILLHENTHVQQRHSIDTLICEWMCALCWFNPFVWLMKKEIRMNLEYLADRSVLDSGCDSEHYQFHLLHLSYHKAAAKLSNNFNVSPLKKRILMMNKKESSKFGLTKYALILPLVATLLFFNSLDLISNENGIPKPEPITGSLELPVTVQEVNPEDTITIFHSSVDVIMPEFPGGGKEMMKWLSENIIYPESAAKKKIEGRVIIRFIVSSTGKIEDIIIQRSANPELNEEAIRAVGAMPDWIPGKHKQTGEPVNVYYTLPVLFKL